jgi:hypothetical protein
MTARRVAAIQVAQRGISSMSFLFVLSIAAAYIVLTSRSLPYLVANHFGPTGVPNGYMTRGSYIGLLMVFLVTLPVGFIFLPNRLLRNPQARINVPYSEYWLAPERRPGSVDFLCRHLARFGVVMILFIGYVHALVLRANALQPPMLSSTGFMVGLGVFFAAVVIWALALMLRFKRTTA